MDEFMNGHVINIKRLAGVKPMLPKMVLTNLQFWFQDCDNTKFQQEMLIEAL